VTKPNTDLQWKRFTSGFLCTWKYSRKPFSDEKNHRASKHALMMILKREYMILLWRQPMSADDKLYYIILSEFIFYL
jgi:hypothetical protein